MPLANPQNLMSFLLEQRLLNGIDKAALQELIPQLEILSYEPGDIIFNEGDLSTDLYLIFEGEVVLVKNDEKRLHQYVIDKLVQGEVFGEMSFIDDSPRSASVKTNHPLILIKLRRREAKELSPTVQEIYEKIIRNIATIIIGRLRDSNQKFTKSKELEIRKLRMHNEFIQLFFNVMMSMLLASAISGSIYLSGLFRSQFDVINWAVLLCMFIPVLIFIKRYQFSLKNFGLSVEKGLSFTGRLVSAASICVIIIGIILYAITYINEKMPVEINQSPLFLLLYPPYAFIVEFLLRGVLQNTIQRLPFNQDRWWSPIFYTAILAAACNPYFGMQTFGFVFLLHLAFGFIYAYEKNIYIASIVHIFSVLTLKFMGFLPFANVT